jgi:O-antigen ligase
VVCLQNWVRAHGIEGRTVKWAGLIIMLAAIIPLSAWLRNNRREASKVWTLVGFLPFILAPFHLLMGVYFNPFWPGYVTGDITVLDALLLALYISRPASPNPLPFLLPMALYFIAVLLSVFQAGSFMDALLYPWQLVRMFLVYATVTGACADERVPPALLKGMTAGLFMEAALAIWQRIGLGKLEADGSFAGHSFLGLVSHLMVFPNFSLLLAGERSYMPGAAVLAGAVIEVLTTSRATIGLAFFGYAVLFLISALRRFNGRKALILSLGIVAISVLAPFAYSSIEKRFSSAVESDPDFDERVAFKKAASMILSDHPFGVGSNHYVVEASKGYNLLAGVPQVAGQNDAFVHNIYWLVAAETGYPGLITFVLLLICPLIVAVRCGWRNRKDKRGDLLLGLGVALLVVYLHSFYEWIFIHYQAQYLFAMEIGLVAGLANQLGYWRRPYRQHAQLGRDTRSARSSRNASVSLKTELK